MIFHMDVYYEWICYRQQNPQSGRITQRVKKLSTKWTDHQNGELIYKSTKWTDHPKGEITVHKVDESPKGWKNCPQSGRITKTVN